MLEASSAEVSSIFRARLEAGTSPKISPPVPLGTVRSISICISATLILTRCSAFTATPSPSLSNARITCSGSDCSE